MSVLLAALAAAAYAASDITTAVAVRRVPPAAIALWAHIIAAVALLAAAAVLAPPPSAAAALAAAGGGLVAGGGAVAYYAALRRGPASVLAPLAAAGLILPVLAGVVRGERTAVLAGLGTLVLLAGIALIAARRDDGGVHVSRAALLLGAGAAVAFGTYFVVVDRAVDAAAGHPLWVAALVVVGSAAAAVPVLLRAGGAAALRPPADARPALLAVGALLAIADLALAAAMAAGDVALVSVVAASDPALTVVAARVVLAERLSRRQAAGVVLTLAGLAGVAAA